MSVFYGIVGFSADNVDILAISLTNEDGVSAAGPGLSICTGAGVGTTCSDNSRILEGMTGQLTLQILAGTALIDGSPSRPPEPMLHSGLDWAVSVTAATATEGTDETLDF